jgi:membrane associated rhomboid family serine protease
MIPISDRIHNRSQPFINYWLIGINIAIFLWELQLELSGELGNFVNCWGIIPAQITAALQNAVFVNSAAWIVVAWRSLSLISAIFIHASFSQILGNLIFLWVFGRTVENFLGYGRYLVFYLTAGIFTGIIQVVLEPNLTVPLVGANGAIAAILGAYYIKFPKAKIDTVLPLLLIYIPTQIPVIFYLFWWLIQPLFYSIGSLNITPSGTNLSSLAYWSQIFSLFIGASYVRIKR